MVDYNFDDTDVRLAVYRAHGPKDHWVITQGPDGSAVSSHGGVVCDLDRQPWPCEPIRNLREWHLNDTHKDQADDLIGPAT